jgi:hypothetical protein
VQHLRPVDRVEHLDFDPPQQRMLGGEDFDAPGKVEVRLALEAFAHADRRPGAARVELAQAV